MTPWREIVETHGGIVWQTALQLLGNHADAADCFQETFLSAMQSRRARQPVRNWVGFLKRVATMRALDMLRKRAASKTSVGGGMDLTPSLMRGPAEDLENEELGNRLARALARLPDQQAEVYCLRHLNELSYEEIAEELGISVSSVGVDLHRARARLRELLGNPCFNESNRGEP